MTSDNHAPGAPLTQAESAALLAWYERVRRDLPWRRVRDPYAIWVSEIMLQQTRVDTVVPYFERFLERFPTVSALAEAAPDDVLAAWSGLGYYRRARMLHEGARAVAAATGELPRTRTELMQVPGIGPYTGAAIASIAFGEPVGVVDGNVARVLARRFGLEGDMRKAGLRQAQLVADRAVSPIDPGAWNQALMELGATVCTPRQPDCPRCPLGDRCHARQTDRVHALPVLAPKAPPKRQRVQALVAVAADGGVLFARRRAEGLFGGMWEPPSMEGALGARRRLVAAIPLRGELSRAGNVEHVLSHRRMVVDVLVGELTRPPEASALGNAYEEMRVVAPTDTGAFGLATLGQKVLRVGLTAWRTRLPPRAGRAGG